MRAEFFELREHLCMSFRQARRVEDRKRLETFLPKSIVDVRRIVGWWINVSCCYTFFFVFCVFEEARESFVRHEKLVLIRKSNSTSSSSYHLFDSFLHSLRWCCSCVVLCCDAMWEVWNFLSTHFFFRRFSTSTAMLFYVFVLCSTDHQLLFFCYSALFAPKKTKYTPRVWVSFFLSLKRFFSILPFFGVPHPSSVTISKNDELYGVLLWREREEVEWWNWWRKHTT